jgi:hypothetical protein
MQPLDLPRLLNSSAKQSSQAIAMETPQNSRNFDHFVNA